MSEEMTAKQRQQRINAIDAELAKTNANPQPSAPPIDPNANPGQYYPPQGNYPPMMAPQGQQPQQPFPQNAMPHSQQPTGNDILTRLQEEETKRKKAEADLAASNKKNADLQQKLDNREPPQNGDYGKAWDRAFNVKALCAAFLMTAAYAYYFQNSGANAEVLGATAVHTVALLCVFYALLLVFESFKKVDYRATQLADWMKSKPKNDPNMQMPNFGGMPGG